MSFLALQKLVAQLSTPIGLLWLLLIGAGIWYWRRKQRGPAIVFTAAALVYAILGNEYAGRALMRSLESRIPPTDIATVAPFDAVFVLGGGTAMDPLGRVQCGLSGDRMILAARLWHAGKARMLVASGNGMGTGHDLGADTRALWQGLGVPASAIITIATPCFITTHEIAAYRALVDERGWKRVGLISSAWHLPRALALAERQQLAMVPLGSDWHGTAQGFQLHKLVPQGTGFLDWQLAAWEYLGRWVGR